MLTIFAKYETTEKILIICYRSQIGEIMTRLNEKYGGKWLFVDQLKEGGEILKLDDGFKYMGFDGKRKRYINGIDTL